MACFSHRCAGEGGGAAPALTDLVIVRPSLTAGDAGDGDLHPAKPLAVNDVYSPLYELTSHGALRHSCPRGAVPKDAAPLINGVAGRLAGAEDGVGDRRAQPVADVAGLTGMLVDFHAPALIIWPPGCSLLMLRTRGP